MDNENGKRDTVRAQALEDLVVTEECPICGRVHKWIWPNHPKIGDQGTRKCSGREIKVKIIPNSDYVEPKGVKVEEVVSELIERAKSGDSRAKKALRRMIRLDNYG